MADCLPAQACTWNKQSWERWRRQVLRGFDAKTLAGALNSMFEQLVAPALVFSQRTTAHETGEEEGGGGGGKGGGGGEGVAGVKGIYIYIYVYIYVYVHIHIYV